MSVNTASADTSGRDKTWRISMTTVQTGHVADFAETKLGGDAIGFGRRGGWIYLVARGT